MKTLLLPRDMRDKQGFNNYVQRTCLKKEHIFTTKKKKMHRQPSIQGSARIIL